MELEGRLVVKVEGLNWLMTFKGGFTLIWKYIEFS